MKTWIYSLAFIEGALVMVFELLAARFVTPFFGNSIYVWSSILGITMLSLLIGYFLGGRLVKMDLHKFLPIPTLVLVSGILLMLPLSHSVLGLIAESFGLISGSLLSAILLLFLPLVLLGSISSQFIQLISETQTLAGVSSGNVYAISTLGGVIATFAVGLFLIPNYGLRFCCLSIGVSSGMLFIVAYLMEKGKINIKSLALALCFLIGAFLLGSSFKIQTTLDDSDADLRYHNDSMMGRLELYELQDSVQVIMNNGALQSKLWSDGYNSSLLYVHIIGGVLAYIPKENRNNALVVGLAAGSLIHELSKLGFGDIDAVDIDPRTHEICQEFTGLEKVDYQFHEDDGRHFLLKNDKKYDVIIIDVSAGDYQPYHLYTKEAIALYKDHLTEQGVIVINIIDFIDRSITSATERIGDGLLSANLKPYLLRNIYNRKYSRHCIDNGIPYEKIIVGSNAPFFTVGNEEALNGCCRAIAFNRLMHQNWSKMAELKTDFSLGPFEDDQPIMELMSYDKAKVLRNNLNNQ